MPRARPWLLGAALSILSACGGGGGGGGGSEAVPASYDLGVLPSTSPTTKPESFSNPVSADATVTVVGTTGPFSVDPAGVPAAAPRGGSASLGIVFTPPGTGTFDGSVTLRFEGSGQSRDVTHPLHAEAEPVTLTLLTPTLSFGEVLLGGEKDLAVRVRNDSLVTSATLSSGTVPAGGFSLPGSPFPVVLSPGATASVLVRYLPTAIGAPAGNLRLGDGDVGGPIVVPVSATTGGEVVTDFGAQSLDGSLLTPTLSVDVPADAISLTVEGSSTGTTTWGLGSLYGPNAKEYENTSSTGAYLWSPGDGVFTASVPNTDRAPLQLVAGGGTYTFRIKRVAGTANSVFVRAIVERRPGGTGSVGVLDLDVWLAKVITPKAATAASDARLQTILSGIDTILSQQGVTLGDVRYHDVTDPTYDDVTSAEFGPMLKLTSAAPTPRLNLFFVRTALGGGILGVSATVAGPKKNGTEASGVMSLYDGGYSASGIALVAAHECGHFLGLFHTTEQDGSHDPVDDTAECPANGTSVACPQAGGGYLMHWQAVGGTTITAGQGLVIRGHPTIDPGLLPPALHAAMVRTPFFVEDRLPEGWCGTCRAVAK